MLARSWPDFGHDVEFAPQDQEDQPFQKLTSRKPVGPNPVTRRPPCEVSGSKFEIPTASQICPAKFEEPELGFPEVPS